VAIVAYILSEQVAALGNSIHMVTNIVLFLAAICYAIWREKIDVVALMRSVVGKFLRRC
jgi:hypothetical protein